MSIRHHKPYSPKELRELRKIKSDYPRVRTRTKIVQDWAANQGRSYQSVCTKIRGLYARKSTKAPSVSIPAVNTVREVRLPIVSWKIENNELVIIY